MERVANEQRETKETKVGVTLGLDGSGRVTCETGIGFFDHMLVLLGAHGGFDLKIEAKGDLQVDGHHTVEDVGIVLGKAFAAALGDKKGINRYGTAYIPMDESLAMVSLDICGRPFLHMELPALSPMIGDFDTQLLEEFFRAFAVHSGITLHLRILYGNNSHHIVEAAFKALGRALSQATTIHSTGQGIPSTKGFMD